MDTDQTQTSTDAATSPEATDGGTKQKKLSFASSFLKKWRINPYLPPENIAVAGDPSTNHGRELTGSFLDDGRALIPWSAEHETIVMSLISTVEFRKLAFPVLAADGTHAMDEQTPPQPLYENIEVGVPRKGAVQLILMGWHNGGDSPEDGDWYAVMDDGRQRRRAVMEHNRRAAWCARLINAVGIGDDQPGKTKPGRRNLLTKIGQLWAKADKAAKDVGARLDLAAAWTKIKAEIAAIPADFPQYESPEIGVPTTDPNDPDATTYPAPLAWLTDVYAKVIVGSEDLGDSTKHGWLRNLKDSDGNVTGVGAHPCWLRIQVVACNVNPADPESLIDGISAKEAQVPTAPSLFAQQVRRVLETRKNPNDPNSPALYSRKAVAAKLGKTDGVLTRYELLTRMCAEVQQLIDKDQLSMTVALSERESAFVKWPKDGEREALPADMQRLILSHLLDEFKTEDGAPALLKGPAVLAKGKQLRDLALKGKLLPVGADDADDDAPVSVPPTGTTAPAPKPTRAAPKSRATIDVAQLREQAARAIGQLVKPANDAPAAEHATYAATVDQLSLARAVGLVLTGAEPLSVLDQWPAVRDVIVAATPVAAPAQAAPKVNEESLALDWISAAIEDAVTKSLDKPVVTTDTDSHGRKPTAEQAASCNAVIDGWVNAFKADQSATSLDDFLMEKVVAAQNGGTHHGVGQPAA